MKKHICIEKPPLLLHIPTAYPKKFRRSSTPYSVRVVLSGLRTVLRLLLRSPVSNNRMMHRVIFGHLDICRRKDPNGHLPCSPYKTHVKTGKKSNKKNKLLAKHYCLGIKVKLGKKISKSRLPYHILIRINL